MRKTRKTMSTALASVTALIATTLLAAPALADPARQSRAATAPSAGIWIASGDMNGDGRPDARKRAQRSRLEQNGTTVATAGDVRAPKAPRRASLLLPAVQKMHEPTQPQRAKLKQNGTTVATASEVQAPKGEGEAALLLPAVQKVHAPAQPQQNGTTVATASEVAAPERD